ncbi:MAG: ABC transporter substrate-binding protein [Acidobacteria bacterium]|nr:ABC transporter substrate-binding protein [Acidobacteriota bacterium]
MDEITLGFRAFDLHELLLHFVAERLGYYQHAGLEVLLRDLTFVTDYNEHTLTVACGSALVARAKGVKQKILFVATDFPMFWIYGDLATNPLRIATFPPLSPPWYMLPIPLRKAGIDTSAAEFFPVRDDIGRIGLLRSGNVDAAVISSAFPPPALARFGLTPLMFFGDHLRIPTTGLAASEEVISRRPEVLARLVDALARSLRAVQENSTEVTQVIAQILGESEDIARQTHELLTPFFAGTGRARPDSVRAAVDFANAELGGTELRVEDVYDFRFVGPS